MLSFKRILKRFLILFAVMFALAVLEHFFPIIPSSVEINVDKIIDVHLGTEKNIKLSESNENKPKFNKDSFKIADDIDDIEKFQTQTDKTTTSKLDKVATPNNLNN